METYPCLFITILQLNIGLLLDMFLIHSYSIMYSVQILTCFKHNCYIEKANYDHFSHLQIMVFLIHNLGQRMIRILDLYNFGDESIVSNPMYKAIFQSLPVNISLNFHSIESSKWFIGKGYHSCDSYGEYNPISSYFPESCWYAVFSILYSRESCDLQLFVIQERVYDPFAENASDSQETYPNQGILQ